MPLLEALLFFSFWAAGLGLSKVEQSQISVSAEVQKSVAIFCEVSSSTFESEVIHWYRQKPNQALEHLIQVSSTKTPAHANLGGKRNKVEAEKAPQNSTSILTVNFIEKGDVATYYCAGWTTQNVWIKIFGKGTKLIVTPPDKKLDGDFSPKPTIFLPSIAETKLHKAGTYLCLLEKFFPDVIKVYWKEKNGDTILESQEGNTMKINGTYMKFSWLTVPQKSFDKEHRCIVEHENTRESKQEILFPAINKGTVLGAVEKKRKPSSLGSENRTVLGTTDMEGKPDHLGYAKDVLRLQLTNSSVYYTYLLLLLKSSVYLAIVTFSLFRRTADCSAEKSS